jgi:SAM-dependent methyltransferase
LGGATVVCVIGIEVAEGALVGPPVHVHDLLAADELSRLLLGALVTTVLSIIVLRRLKAASGSYAMTLTASYAGLVAAGDYSPTFEHSPWARNFFESVVPMGLYPEESGPLRILEPGVGTGVWLDVIRALPSLRGRAAALYGFDLSAAMVATARERLRSHGTVAEIRVGDVLNPDDYRFDDADAFDLIYAYDLVQQLPATLQMQAVDEMARHLTRSGTLIVFDQERRSGRGRAMGLKKWLRRHTGLPLVPRHYIHSRYPELHGLAARYRQRPFRVSEVVEAEGRKRALVISRPTPSRVRSATAAGDHIEGT